jgi:hypothetical protein
VSAKGPAPTLDLPVGEVSAKVMCKAIADFRNDPKVGFDRFADQAETSARRNLGAKRAKRGFRLHEPPDLPLVVDEKVDRHLCE